MSARAKAITPLAIVIGVLSFLWTEFSLNFTFHWVTQQDEVLGDFGMPENFHLILPTAFISWGLFFAAGGDNAAFGKIFLAIVFGTVAALVTMPLAFKTADFDPVTGDAPFWGIALWVGIFAFVLVMILIAGDWYYVAGTFPCFAAVFLWWIATGLDGYVPNGGGSGDKLEAFNGALAGSPIPPEQGTAGVGAFLGLISTPWQWVWFNTFVTLICGIILGIVSAKVAAVLTPKPKAAPAEAT
jgi:Protein of unknown function (DUF1097)